MSNRKGEWRMKQTKMSSKKIQIYVSIICYFCLLKGNGNFHQLRQSYEILFYALELLAGRMFIVALPP